MRGSLPISFGFLASLAAVPALAGGTMKLDFSGAPPEKMQSLRIEVLEVSGKKANVAYKSDATKIASEGVDLKPGSYRVYLEDRETGLIVRVDERGAGFKVKENGRVDVDVPDLGTKIKAVKDRDRTERQAVAEQLKQRSVKFRKGGGSSDHGAPSGPSAPGAPKEGGFEAEHASGELILKFQSDTNLADRYDVISALGAENRSKLDKIDVYRVKVSEAADLQALIQQFADDPRVKYLEMNMTVSVPEPIEEGQ